MTLPTFIIGGAPRSGTTWLYDVLQRHPDIYLAEPRSPEPKFFLVDSEYEKGLSYYEEKYFAAARGQKAIGEKSTNYLENADVPRRIMRCVPAVKMVFLLRDPVERAFSNYLWSKKNGLETLSFDEAIETEAQRETEYPPKWQYARPFSYVSRGFYARLLKPWFDQLDASRMHLMMLEEVLASPQPRLAELCEFLGVPMAKVTIDTAERINTARQGDEAMSPSALERLQRTFRQPNRELAEMLGRELPGWM